MPTIDLKARYGEGKTQTIVNRAIREELLGGDALLDARTYIYKYMKPGRIRDDLNFIIDDALMEMRNEIRRRYEMPLLKLKPRSNHGY